MMSNNKKILSVTLFLIFFFSFNVYASETREIIVDMTLNNDVLYVGGIGTDNFTLIQDAIDTADVNNTIYVYTGIYYEKILINKSINLIGENKHTTIIDADEKGNAVKIVSNKIRLCNFTIQNTGIGNSPEFLENSAIEIFSSDFNIIENMICNNTNYGIRTDNHSDNNLIRNNTVYAFYDGIWLEESKNNILRNNYLYGPGLVLGGSSIELLTHDIDKSNIVNGKPVYYYLNENSIKAPIDAGQVILVNCSNCIVADLEISYVTDGMEVLFSDNNTIRNNTIFDTTDFGIRMDKSNNNLITDNRILYCPIGIGFIPGGFDGFRGIADCKYNKIINNSFESNGLGISFVRSNYNQIYMNNFIENKIDNARFVCSYKNHWNKNYWDDWKGLKYESLRYSPKTIFGSIIKNLPWAKSWINFDHNPMEKPYLYVEKSKTIYVDDDGCADYDCIQDAIYNAFDGDTVFVCNGTYYENIIIDKSIKLIGENKTNTIIDGMMKGDTVAINAEGVTLSNFTITHGATDITNDICRAGIRITRSNNNIKNNIIKDNLLGIFGLRVTNLTICNNQFYDDGITFSPYENEARPKIFMEYFLHNIYNNTINDKPLYYYTHQNDFTVPKDAGMIILTNCTNVTITDVNLTRSDNGLLMAYSSKCLIEHSNISNSDGIWTFCSSQNIFQFNTLSNNFHGITLDYHSNENIVTNNNIHDNQMAGVMIEYYSINNHITKNNLINNAFPGYFTQAFRNKWDQNYYSNWTGLKHPKLSFLPQLIQGRPLDLYPKMGICFKIDWNPAKMPYN